MLYQNKLLIPLKDIKNKQPLTNNIMNFIELTDLKGKRFIGNINELKRVFVDDKDQTCVVGWNNNGYFEVQESYEEVIEKVNARLAGVNRLKHTTTNK
jgi:uncharacterized protein YlzI (FlbEa/FlbD family)